MDDEQKHDADTVRSLSKAVADRLGVDLRAFGALPIDKVYAALTDTDYLIQSFKSHDIKRIERLTLSAHTAMCSDPITPGEYVHVIASLLLTILHNHGLPEQPMMAAIHLSLRSALTGGSVDGFGMLIAEVPEEEEVH